MKTEWEKMLSGEPYFAGDPDLVERRNRAKRIAYEFNQLSPVDREHGDRLIKELFGRTGEKVHVSPVFWCDYGSNIYVGENFYMNNNCIILDVCEVHIGDNCLIGPMVGIYTATHPLDWVTRSQGVEGGKPITIGNDVWIGGSAVINPGVTIGDRVVVASGAVVTKDVEDDVLVAGCPARVIRRLK